MAVVLPIHSPIDFTSCTENDYENRCQNEEEETGEEITENNHSNVFLYNGSQDENSADDSLSCHLLSEKEIKSVKSDERNLSMGVDDEDSNPDTGSCADFDEKPNSAMPLTSSGQIDSGAIDPIIENDSNSNNANEDDPVLVVEDNYWLMDNEIENQLPETHPDSRDGSDNGAENLAFLSSLMEVDIASTSTTDGISENRAGTYESADCNAASVIDEDEQDHPKEDKMEVEASEIPITEESITEVIAETNVVSVAESPKELSYGGLENLGNTCYMASAIQLLCALDSFPAELKDMVPPESNGDKEGMTGIAKSQPLRDALLNVMDRLQKGETVRPDRLKRCIDSRTSLFLGYHQQDSHEFLTTLLDIIDEDYKIKTKPEESAIPAAKVNDEKKEGSDNEDRNDDGTSVCGRLEHSKKSYEMLGNKHSEEETDDDENDDVSDVDGADQESPESAVKRQKIVEDGTSSLLENESKTEDVIESSNMSTDTNSAQRSKSYSQFMFSDIESLLHDKDKSPKSDNVATTTGASSSLMQEKNPAKQDEPKCKLAGGRMSTAGVELTRFVDGGADIDENVRSTDASLDIATPQQQIMEGDQHDKEEEGESEETSLSPVSSNFTTKVRVCLTCDSCKFRRSHIETYLHLSLDITTASTDDDDMVGNLGVPSSSSIEEGLRRFFAPEKRDIKCEKCFHNSALQTTEITQLPRNLLFHLKRFIVDVSPDYSSISYRKDQSPVVFEERIELDGPASKRNDSNLLPLRSVHDDEDRGFRDFLAMDCSYPRGAAYEIRSVVNHIGSTASCGHYTGDAKRRKLSSKRSGSGSYHDAPDEGDSFGIHDDGDNVAGDTSTTDDREWMRFNDSYVSKISSKEAVEDASQTAYMIMYELVQ